MGTKRALAASVAAQVGTSRAGPLLDVFAGMCSVGSRVGADRQIWNNDLQVFASTVAHAFFCADDLPPLSFDIADRFHKAFDRHRSDLSKLHETELRGEEDALRAGSAAPLADFEAELQKKVEAQTTADELERCRTQDHYPLRLFTLTYAGSYLGLRQCIEIDSIRYCIDDELARGRLSKQGHEWLCLGVARAMARCSTSTGHFAQPLKPKPHTIARYRRQRMRSIWQEWLFAVDGLAPVGTSRWRSKNRVFCSEAVDLLQGLNDGVPAVIYADPPYTSDQYSRYYHLYETLLLYDYPPSLGVGRYRTGRAVSSFSLKAGVHSAMASLIDAVAALGSDFVLSYPTNGLLERSREMIPDMLSAKFKSVCKPIELPHMHSAMGGSKGEAKYAVTEVIYKATA